MSLVKSSSSLSLASCESNPLKLNRADTYAGQTQACTEDQDSVQECLSEESFDESPRSQRRLTESVSIKLQILTRSGFNASRISLLSVSNRPSFSLMDIPQFGESKSRNSTLTLQAVDPILESEHDEEKAVGSFRNRYIHILKQKHILDSTSKRKHQSVVIIDWDGALFGGIDIDEVKTNKKFSKGESILRLLDQSTSILLRKMVQDCLVFIVTNYSEESVEHSACLYLPLTYQIMKNHAIQIISLKQDLERRDDHNLDNNKSKNTKGLMQIKRALKDSLKSNIVCVVDSETKINILERLTNKFHDAFVKFLMFKDSVKAIHLIKQQQLLYKEYESVLGSLRNFTMHFAKNPPAQ